MSITYWWMLTSNSTRSSTSANTVPPRYLQYISTINPSPPGSHHTLWQWNSYTRRYEMRCRYTLVASLRAVIILLSGGPCVGKSTQYPHVSPETIYAFLVSSIGFFVLAYWSGPALGEKRASSQCRILLSHIYNCLTLHTIRTVVCLHS